MNGGRGRAPGAGSPMLTSCSSQMCSWMMSCCLALQVTGDHGEQPERWDDEERAGIFSDCRAGLHPARQRVCRALVSVAGRGVGSSECYPDGVSGHPPSRGAWAWGAAALGAARNCDCSISSLHSTWLFRPPCSASSTSSCCPPCPRSHLMPTPPASCWHEASLPVASPQCCRPPWGAGEQGKWEGAQGKPLCATSLHSCHRCLLPLTHTSRKTFPPAPHCLAPTSYTAPSHHLMPVLPTQAGYGIQQSL